MYVLQYNTGRYLDTQSGRELTIHLHSYKDGPGVDLCFPLPGTCWRPHPGSHRTVVVAKVLVLRAMYLQQEFQHAHSLQADSTLPVPLACRHDSLPVQGGKEDGSLVQAKRVYRKPGYIEGHVVCGLQSQMLGSECEQKRCTHSCVCNPYSWPGLLYTNLQAACNDITASPR